MGRARGRAHYCNCTTATVLGARHTYSPRARTRATETNIQLGNKIVIDDDVGSTTFCANVAVLYTRRAGGYNFVKARVRTMKDLRARISNIMKRARAGLFTSVRES